MNLNKISKIFIIFFLAGCQQINTDKKSINYPDFQKYINTGFALIYDDELRNNKKISRKIDNKSLFIFHKTIKKNSYVKITNPLNNKSIIAKVISSNVKFSDFYNSVITKRIANELSIDLSDPYINLVLISKNSTFIAKKAKTFDEEKKVAEKAPIDGIQINDLSKTKKKEKKITKEKFSYSIKIADFYYKSTAKMMITRIKDETSIKNSRIKKLSQTRFRVLIGPFNDIKSLKESFEKIKSLNFENLEVLKNV